MNLLHDDLRVHVDHHSHKQPLRRSTCNPSLRKLISFPSPSVWEPAFSGWQWLFALRLASKPSRNTTRVSDPIVVQPQSCNRFCCSQLYLLHHKSLLNLNFSHFTVDVASVNAYQVSTLLTHYGLKMYLVSTKTMQLASSLQIPDPTNNWNPQTIGVARAGPQRRQ